MWSFTAVLFEFNWRLKCSFALMPKCRVVMPMYDIVASRKHVNLYTTFDNSARGVKHFKLK